MNKEEEEKLYGFLNDLGWEYKRMSADEMTVKLLQTQMTLNTIYEMIGIELDDTLDFQYMINKVEGK